MSDEKKTLGQVLCETKYPRVKWDDLPESDWRGLCQRNFNEEAAGIAAVCRAVLAEREPPKPEAASEAGDDLIDAVEVGIDGWVKREYLAQCRMSVLEQIRPRFDAVCAERDTLKMYLQGAEVYQRESRECHAMLTGKGEMAWCMAHPTGELETELGKAVLAVRQRAEAAESELAKRPDERSCLAALMAISDSLGLTGIVNPTHAVGGVESMKAERDKLKSELADAIEKARVAESAMISSGENFRKAIKQRDDLQDKCHELHKDVAACRAELAELKEAVNNQQVWPSMSGGFSNARPGGVFKTRCEAYLAAYRSTKGKEQGDGPK